MKALNGLWADRQSLIKFFYDAPSMDINARLNYFHDVFPYAELLPINFYLTDSNNISIACNQMTLQTLGDKSIEDYFGYHLHEYVSRKGWPKKIADIWSENNNAAFLSAQTIVCHETSVHGNGVKKWISKKQPIYDDNGQAIGIIGITIPNGYDYQSVSWNSETKHIAISFSDNYLVEFSKREFCVLQGMLNGNTAEDIASKENISRKTVETYMMRVKIKLNCEKLRDVISFCIKNDLAKNIVEFRYNL